MRSPNPMEWGLSVGLAATGLALAGYRGIPTRDERTARQDLRTVTQTYRSSLLPILWSHGAGTDVMKRIATPMIGGVVTSTVMELIVCRALFYVWRSRRLHNTPAAELILQNSEERKELV